MLLQLSSLSNILFETKYSQRIAKGIVIAFALLLLWVIWDMLKILHLGMHALPKESLSNRQTISLARMHLFGQSNIVDPNYLPETKENFVLNGAFVSQVGQRSQAIITVLGQQKVYFIGDTLSSNIKVKQILPNKVVLQHNGQLEALTMGRTSLEFANPPQGFSRLQ
ncbi:MAG: type II secretion system protein N [Gammaproteobacteria bacterium]